LFVCLSFVWMLKRSDVYFVVVVVFVFFYTCITLMFLIDIFTYWSSLFGKWWLLEESSFFLFYAHRVHGCTFFSMLNTCMLVYSFVVLSKLLRLRMKVYEIDRKCSWLLLWWRFMRLIGSVADCCCDEGLWDW
jgi:hypothetical protein